MRAILTWHSLDRSGSPISVPPEEFRRQVEWLAASGVRAVTVGKLLELPDEEDAAALTFDDGFANFGEAAAPVLSEYGITPPRVPVAQAEDGVQLQITILARLA